MSLRTSTQTMTSSSRSSSSSTSASLSSPLLTLRQQVEVPEAAEEEVDINSLVPNVCAGATTFLSIVFAWLSLTLIIPLGGLLPLLAYTAPTGTALRILQLLIVGMPLVGSAVLLSLVYRVLGGKSVIPSDRTPFIATPIKAAATRHIELKKVYILINPTSGGQGLKPIYATMANKVLPALRAAAIEHVVVYTQHQAHATELIAALDFSRFDAILAVGGDGHMAEIVNGMLSREDKKTLPLSLIATGSGNSYNADLGSWAVERSLQSLLAGDVNAVDVNLLTDDKQLHLYSINTAGFGIVGDAAVIAEGYRWLGGARYDVCAVWILLKAVSHRFISTLNNDSSTTVDSTNFQLCFVNQTQHFGKGLRSCPKAKLNDGKLDVIYLHAATRVDMLRLFLLMPIGAHTDHPAVRYVQAQSVTFNNPQKPLNVITVDGNNTIYHGELKLQCVPDAIEIFSSLDCKGRDW